MATLRESIRAASARRAGRMIQCEVAVEAVAVVSPSFRRVTVRGDGLSAYIDPLPADAFRLFLHPPAAAGTGSGADAGAAGPDDRAELSRAFTVRTFDPAANRLTFDVHRHGSGFAAGWLDRLWPGDTADLLGMRVEFAPPEAGAPARTSTAILVADGSGLPAVAAILAALPAGQPAVVLLSGLAEQDLGLLPERPGDDLRLVPAGGLPAAVRALTRPDGGALAFVAAEASEVRVIRRLLAEDLGVPRGDLRASAYWRAGETMEEADAAAELRYAEAAAQGRDLSDPAVLEELALA
ncbi:siderophore-interacting protein [Parafrankia sp. BMG5.11]|uniref:siderophore-interacting protein n=1 Tax=Parafrankia sp. BMG5.11 TaxID=222540 RepID=UPI00103A6898|nr:siderophore-interacting protein [Parafrankia sp. BMG5.11]TCJ32844.1 siderophore-interacting protein [Parafrankia sp. BMG5.11]